MTTSTKETTSETFSIKVRDESLILSGRASLYQGPLSKEDAKGKPRIDIDTAYYHCRIMPTQSFMAPQVTVTCGNYPDKCKHCCERIAVVESEDGKTVQTCRLGAVISDTVAPALLSMLEEEE